MAPIWTTAPFVFDVAYSHLSAVSAASPATGFASISMDGPREIRPGKSVSRPRRRGLGSALPDHQTRFDAPGRDRRGTGARLPSRQDRSAGSEWSSNPGRHIHGPGRGDRRQASLRYITLIREGARAHGLPENYIRF